MGGKDIDYLTFLGKGILSLEGTGRVYSSCEGASGREG